MNIFKKEQLKNLFRPATDSSGEQNGQVTIVGGSKLFHGAPILPLIVASRIVDMVFFASPEPGVGEVAKAMRTRLMSFIWVPWEDVKAYIRKSDAVLIGPGFMRFESEERKHEEIKNGNRAGEETRKITKELLEEIPDKKWVIDAACLKVMEAEWIPAGAIVTPNKSEFETLFRTKVEEDRTIKAEAVVSFAAKYNCTIVLKGPETIVASPNESILVTNGNPGMTKGGTGDVLAGLTVALLAKNNAFLAASAASYIAKAAADELYEKVGPNYNADDLADKIPETLYKLIS